MRRFTGRRLSLPCVTAVLAGLLAAPAWGQRSNGYLFIAPGGVTCCGQTSATLHAGIGGEWVAWRGIGAGAEAGALGANQHLISSGFGLASANGYYHFRHDKDTRLDPFVTGGYSVAVRMGHANLGNLGGGVNYWFSHHFGGRVEFRDHIYPTPGPTVQYWGVRFGIAFH